MFNDVHGIRWGRLALVCSFGWLIIGWPLMLLKPILTVSAYEVMWIIYGWLSFFSVACGVAFAITWIATRRQRH